MKLILLMYISLAINSIIIPTNINLVNIGVGSLDVLEIVCWAIFLIGIYCNLLMRFKPLKKYGVLLKKNQQISFLIFTLLFIVSMVLGIINHNINTFAQSRGMALFIIVFLMTIVLFDYKNKKRKKYDKYIFILFGIAAISVILSYVSSSFTNIYNSFLGVYGDAGRFQRSVSGQFGTYSFDIAAVTSFIYFRGASNILFNHKKIRYYFIALIGFVSTNIFFHKPVVMAFVIGNVVMLLLYFYLKVRISAFIKIIKYLVISFAIIYLVISILPHESIDQTIAYFNYGWLNIGRSGVENDLSTGRFTLWSQYGSYALRGVGFAPWGIGSELVGASESNPHNLIVFLSYNIGIFSALIFLYFITSIFYDTLIFLKNQKRFDKEPSYAAIFGIFTYLITVFIQAQYGGILDSLRTFIFLFSSSLAILLHLKHGFLGEVNSFDNSIIIMNKEEISVKP